MKEITVNRKMSIFRQLFIIVLQGVIFASSAFFSYKGLTDGLEPGQISLHNLHFSYFNQFTMDSNVFGGITALLLILCCLLSLLLRKDITPRWVVFFQFLSTACLLLTFLVTALFLAPYNVSLGRNYFSLFKGRMFFFHLMNPLLSVFSFIVLQKKYRFRRLECIFGMIPTILYGIRYYLNVIVYKKWEDFYHFTFGGKTELVPAVMAVAIIVILLLSFLLIILNRAAQGEAEE